MILAIVIAANAIVDACSWSDDYSRLLSRSTVAATEATTSSEMFERMRKHLTARAEHVALLRRLASEPASAEELRIEAVLAPQQKYIGVWIRRVAGRASAYIVRGKDIEVRPVSEPDWQTLRGLVPEKCVDFVDSGAVDAPLSFVSYASDGRCGQFVFAAAVYPGVERRFPGSQADQLKRQLKLVEALLEIQGTSRDEGERAVNAPSRTRRARCRLARP